VLKKKKCPNDVVDFFHVAGDFLDKLKMGDLALLTIIARGIWL
jgi:phosphosulfolactate synthase (CoM biosynthesis protein A)